MQDHSNTKAPAKTPVAPNAAAPAVAATPAPRSRARAVTELPGFYAFLVIAFAAAGLSAIWYGNKKFAPEMYDAAGPQAFADAFAKGRNFGTFDLNINIREMRNNQIRSFDKTPEVVVMGASHWQEGHVELMPSRSFYNAHVHRDYYEDMLAMTEMFVRHSRLPKKMIIAIRDRLFTPVADRTDFLWLPGIPYYRAMARRLGMEPHPYWETAPVERWRELISLPMLVNNVRRWYSEPVKPHETRRDHFETLDTLRPGGSIYWSGEHMKLFTQERSRKLSLEFADGNLTSPPKIDPEGVRHIDRLFAFLKDRGIEVFLVHPPFNPIYWEKVQNSPYMKGVEKIKKLTKDLAKKHGFKTFGSFDPHHYGCTAEMYIDAEHSNPECLRKVFAEYMALDPVPPQPPFIERPPQHSVPMALKPEPKAEAKVAALPKANAPAVKQPAKAASETPNAAAAREAEARRRNARLASVPPKAALPSRRRRRAKAATKPLLPLPERNPLAVPADRASEDGLISIHYAPDASAKPVRPATKRHAAGQRSL